MTLTEDVRRGRKARKMEAEKVLRPTEATWKIASLPTRTTTTSDRPCSSSPRPFGTCCTAAFLAGAREGRGRGITHWRRGGRAGRGCCSSAVVPQTGSPSWQSSSSSTSSSWPQTLSRTSLEEWGCFTTVDMSKKLKVLEICLPFFYRSYLLGSFHPHPTVLSLCGLLPGGRPQPEPAADGWADCPGGKAIRGQDIPLTGRLPPAFHATMRV